MTWKVARRFLSGVAHCAAAMGLVLATTAPGEAAALLTLEDGNSKVDLCVGSDCDLVGAYNWFVDGEDRLFQEWFWYRVDIDYNGANIVNPTLSLDSISDPLTTGGAGGNSATVTYENAYVKATVEYLLEGGATDSNTSKLSEVVKITNKTSSFVLVNLFQYSDFDLCGPGSADNVSIVDGVATQTSAVDCDGVMSQVFGHYSVNHEANESPVTISNIENNDTLNGNSQVNNVNATSAFQWVGYATAAGPEFYPQNEATFYITKQIAPAVPEPMSMMLLGTGLLAVGRTARRRLKARS